MSLLFIDGFDHYSTSDLVRKWDKFSNTVSLWTIDTGVYRTGTSSLRLPNNEGNYIGKNLPIRAYTVTVGFALYINNQIDGHGGYQLCNEQGIQATVKLQSDGSVGVYRGDAATLLEMSGAGEVSAGVWQYLEYQIYVANSGGTFSVKVDGSTIITGESYDTQQQSAGGVTSVWFSSIAGYYSYIDDLYILDNSGTFNNDFLGDMEVATLYPTGAGNYTQWTPSGETYNYECVNESVLDTATYITCSGENLIDTYTYQDPTEYVTDNIRGVQITSWVGKSMAGTEAIQNVCRIGSSDYSGEALYLPSTHASRETIYDKNPDDDAQWEYSDVCDAEFGVKRTTT